MFIECGIHFHVIKDPETWKFISQIIHNLEEKNLMTDIVSTSNLVPVLFLLGIRSLMEKYTLTSKS